MSSGHSDHGGAKKYGSSHNHDHNAHGHDAHGHDGHDHDAHGGGHDHDAHGGGHGHDAHGGGHGHDAHGHCGHGHDAHGASKMPSRIGLGGILGIIILLGIPSLFSKFGGDNGGDADSGGQGSQEIQGKGILASYTVGNARSFYGVEVKAVQQSVIETSHSQFVPVVYLFLASGERLMAMDMSVLNTLGVSNAAVSLSRDAYRKAVTLRPGYFTIEVTGEPPPEFILAGIAPLVIGIGPS